MIDFNLRLTGHGWLECRISDGRSETTATASHLTDAIREFVAAVQRLATASEAACEFAEEPGAYRWQFERSGDRVKITVTWNEEQSKFEGECNYLDFARAVDRELDRALEELGEQGYEKLWGWRFPKQAQERLKQTIRQSMVSGT